MQAVTPAMFQCLLGLQCKDFTMIAADQMINRGFAIIKNDSDKLISLPNNIIMGVNGDEGDITQFTQFVNSNLALYHIRNGYHLDTAASVHFTRKSLADSYGNGMPVMINFLIGGWDEVEGGQLYILDSLATCNRVPFCAHGFGGMIGVSILEYLYKRDMIEGEAYEALQICIKEIQARLFLNLPNFQVKVVSKNGISSLPVMYAPKIVASPGIDISKADAATRQETGKQESDIQEKKRNISGSTNK